MKADLDYQVRNPTVENVPEILDLFERAFHGTGSDFPFTEAELSETITRIPSAQFVALHKNRIVGASNGEVGPLPKELPEDEEELIQHFRDSSISTFNAQSIFYYQTMIGVDPKHRRKGIARSFYQKSKTFVIDNGLDGIVAAGVAPDYLRQTNGEISFKKYATKVIAKQLTDSTLTSQLNNGLSVLGVVSNFFIYPPSKNNATVLFWPNPKKEQVRSPHFESQNFSVLQDSETL